MTVQKKADRAADAGNTRRLDIGRTRRVFGDHQLLPGDYVLEQMVTNTTVRLPSAAGLRGRRFEVKDSNGQTDGANPITVTAINGETVDGAASVTIAAAFGRVVVISDGEKWLTE